MDDTYTDESKVPVMCAVTGAANEHMILPHDLVVGMQNACNMDDLPLSMYNTETTTLSYNNDDAVLDTAEHVNVVTRSGTDTTPVKDAK